MKNETKKSRSFLDIYSHEIKPKLEKIDLALHEATNGLSAETAAALLDVTVEEVTSILSEYRIEKIDCSTIASLMSHLSSSICRLFSRELSCGVPCFYSAENISYIYGLEKKDVDRALAFLDLAYVSSKQLPAVFVQITV